MPIDLNKSDAIDVFQANKTKRCSQNHSKKHFLNSIHLFLYKLWFCLFKFRQKIRAIKITYYKKYIFIYRTMY